MQYKMGNMLCEIAYGLEAALTVGRKKDAGKDTTKVRVAAL